MFNSDVLREATLYKGVIPAQYGERSSSVLQIETIDGDPEKYNVSASIGLLSSRIEVDGPIIKDKTTFVVAARRTYIDIF